MSFRLHEAFDQNSASWCVLELCQMEPLDDAAVDDHDDSAPVPPVLGRMSLPPPQGRATMGTQPSGNDSTNKNTATNDTDHDKILYSLSANSHGEVMLYKDNRRYIGKEETLKQPFLVCSKTEKSGEILLLAMLKTKIVFGSKPEYIWL